jgi:hypothetical protein
MMDSAHASTAAARSAIAQSIRTFCQHACEQCSVSRIGRIGEQALDLENMLAGPPECVAAVLGQCCAGSDHAGVGTASHEAATFVPRLSDKLEQFHGNLAAANVMLSAEQVAQLEKVSAIAPVYPFTVLDDPRILDLITGGKLDLIDAPTKRAP